MNHDSETANLRASVGGSLKKLFKPLLAPHQGFQAILAEEDPVSFGVFSVLLTYFLAALGYSFVLRRYLANLQPSGAEGAFFDPVPGLGPAAWSRLVAAIPFITALTSLTAMLLTGLFLLIAGKIVRSNRPFGHWVGLAAFCALPGMLRLLCETLRIMAGRPPADTPALSVSHLLVDSVTLAPYISGLLQSLDPFQIWSLVIMALGFSVYTKKPAWIGALVALVFWLMQGVLATGWTASVVAA